MKEIREKFEEITKEGNQLLGAHRMNASIPNLVYAFMLKMTAAIKVAVQISPVLVLVLSSLYKYP